MGTEYLIDSNVVIEFLGGMLAPSSSNWLQEIIEKNNHCLSVINQIELLGFNAPASEMQTLHEFVASSLVLPLSDSVVRKTIELRRMHKIKLPDAVIAATALVYNSILITRNISDFDKIQGLELIHSHR